MSIGDRMKILSVHTSILGENAAWWRISNIVEILRAKGHGDYFMNKRYMLFIKGLVGECEIEVRVSPCRKVFPKASYIRNGSSRHDS